MISVESLELHVSNHCNLSCKGCCHLTPLEKIGFLDLNTTLTSLNILNKFLHCNVIRLLGGEPTLNPDLSTIVKKVKSIGISDLISIPTNGTLLNKITDEILDNINIIEISNYNYSLTKTNQIISWAKGVKKKHKNVKIIIYMYQYFREPYSYIKNINKNQIQDIYESCIISNKWQCFNVYENYIFKCPEALALSKNIMTESFEINGLKIEDKTDFELELKNYLFNTKCLSACQYCLGTTGKLFNVTQTSKQSYIEAANIPICDLLDQDFLNECLNNDVGDMKTVKEVIEI